MGTAFDKYLVSITPSPNVYLIGVYQSSARPRDGSRVHLDTAVSQTTSHWGKKSIPKEILREKKLFVKNMTMFPELTVYSSAFFALPPLWCSCTPSFSQFLRYTGNCGSTQCSSKYLQCRLSTVLQKFQRQRTSAIFCP
jgi:hypothetical protein